MSEVPMDRRRLPGPNLPTVRDDPVHVVRGQDTRVRDAATAPTPDRFAPGCCAHRPIDAAVLLLLILRAPICPGRVRDRAAGPGMEGRAARVIARAMAVIEEETA